MLKSIIEAIQNFLSPNYYDLDEEAFVQPDVQHKKQKVAQAKRYQNTFTEEEMNLALGWAEEFVSYSHVIERLKLWGIKTNGYSFLARALKQNYRQEKQAYEERVDV